MKNLLSYLLVMFMVMFWIFRVIVAFSYSMALNFAIEPLNMNVEVVLLFIALVCILLVVKRKVFGALLYAISYGAYFGVNVYNVLMVILGYSESTTSLIDQYTSVFTSFIGIVLALAVLVELLLDKNRKNNPVDVKTDWFFKNKDYDRKYDERADKNNYRTL